MSDELTPERVEPLLEGRLGRPYVYVASCPSTQRLLPSNGPEGAVVLADEQTDGRGRFGRSWHAPRGTSLLFSVLLYPRVPSERLPELSLVAGRAVASAIAEATGLEPTLKHPNDVLVDGMKVCGILAEASDGRVALGIGINVNQRFEELPVETDTPPTSLRVQAGGTFDRARLLVGVLARLEREYDMWVEDAGLSASTS